MNCSNVKWVAVLKGDKVTDKVLGRLSAEVANADNKMAYPKFVERLRFLTGLETASSATKLILIEDGATEMPSTDRAFYFVKAQDLALQRCYIGNVKQQQDSILERVSTSIQV